MAIFVIGKLFGKNIYIGDSRTIKNDQYYLKLDGKTPIGLYIKLGGQLQPIFVKDDAKGKLVLENVDILSTNHGNSVIVNPSKNYDAIGKVTYKPALLEEKDTIVITENNKTVQIQAGSGYDGLDDIVVRVEIPEQSEEPE